MSKKHSWFNYNSSAEILEITIRDWSEAKIDSWRVNSKDKGKIKKIFRTIKEKYDINLFIELKKDKDMEWMP